MLNVWLTGLGKSIPWMRQGGLFFIFSRSPHWMGANETTGRGTLMIDEEDVDAWNGIDGDDHDHEQVGIDHDGEAEDDDDLLEDDSEEVDGDRDSDMDYQE